MTGGRDEGFVRLGDVVARIADVVRAKRRRRAASTARVVDLDAPPPLGRRGIVDALAVLTEAGVIDPGTGARLLKRVVAVGEPASATDVSERPGTS